MARSKVTLRNGEDLTVDANVYLLDGAFFVFSTDTEVAATIAAGDVLYILPAP